TSIPLLPHRSNRSGDGMNPVPLLFLYKSPVGCCPSYFASAGFGSNVSTCDGPPFMNRKITRFARGANCGIGPLAPTDAIALCPSSPARPTTPKPAHVCRSICRRLRRFGLIDIKRLITSQQNLGVFVPARHPRRDRAPEKTHAQLHF